MAAQKPNSQRQIAQARQQLEAAQARIAELEARLAQVPQEITIDRYALDNLLEGRQIISFDWRYLYVNDAAARYGRQSKSDLLGHTVRERYPGIETTDVFAVLQRCMTSRIAENAEFEFVYEDGSRAWFEFRIQPVPEGIFILTLDITERKQAEEAILRSEERFHALFDTMTEGVAVHTLIRDEAGTPTDYRIVTVNPAFVSHTGILRETAIGKLASDLYAVRPPPYFDIYRNVVETGQATSFDTYFAPMEKHFSISVFSTGADGFATVFEDITERRRAEENIQKLNRTLAVLSDINQAIIRVRPIPVLLETACRIAVEKGGFSLTWVGLLDDETQQVNPVAHAGVESEYLNKLGIALNDSSRGQEPASLALRTGQHVIWNDIETVPDRAAALEEAVQQGCRAGAAFPLVVFGRVRGVVNLYTSTPGFFDTQELRLLDEMAGDISFAMEFAEQEMQRQQAAAMLRASEEKYRSLVESSDSVIAVFDADGVLLYGNQIAARSLHQTPETLVGKHMHDLFPPAVADYQFAAIRRAITTGEGSVAESLSSVNGERRWYRTSVQPIRGASGEVTSALINAVDITRFKQAEAELREAHDTLELKVEARTAELQASKAQVEAILDNSLDGILLVSSGFRILRSNHAFNIMLGCQPGACLDRLLFDLIYVDDRERGQRIIQEMIAGQVGGQIEMRCVRKDGSVFDAEIGIGRLTNDEFVCTIRDITERKAQERQLRYYASLQESVSDAVIATDRNFRIQSWNRAAERIYGWRSDEVIGKTATEVLQTRFESKREQDRIVEAFLAQGYWHGEFTQRHKDGRDVHILGSTTLFRDEQGVPVGIVSVNRDDTERRAAEQALRASEERYRQMFERNMAVKLLIDAETGAIVDANPSAAQFYGYSLDALKAMHISEINNLPPERVFSAMEEIAAGARVVFEFQHRLANGEIRDVEVYSSPLEIQGRALLFSIIVDISERKRAEDALRSYAADIHDLYNNAPCGYHSLDKDGLIIQINDTELRWLGYPRDEVVNRLRITDLFTPESVRTFRETFPGFIQRGWVNDLEFDVVRKDGSILHILLNGTAIYDEDGRYLKSRSTMFDITELKRARLALVESEARYRLLAENVTDVIARLNPEGIRTFITPSCYALLGYNPEELIGKVAWEMTHPDDLPAIRAELAQAIQSGQTSYVTTGRIRHKAGYYVWTETRVNIVRDPLSGAVVETIGVIRDITERKRAEETLRESEERFRQIADNIDQVLFVRSGDDQTMLYISPMYETMWGKSRESLYRDANSFLEVVHPDDRELVREHLTSARRFDEGTEDYEYRIFAPDTQIHWVRVRMFPILGEDGSIIRRVGIIEDVTRQKQYAEMLERALEQEKELSELKSRFVSMASHEFRTPLASILSSTELLINFRQKMDDEKIERKLTLITEHVAHLTSVIEDVLQLARMQAHRVEFNPVVLEPDSLCREIIEEFQNSPEAAHQLTYVGPETPLKMLLDKRLVRQIISNLLSNALKYSPRGTPVTLDMAIVGKMLVLTVRDEGIGIPEADLKRLFEPFHRAGNVGTIPGTGLGLSITKESVVLHGGTIAVESDEGVGTIFTVTLPIRTAAP